MKNKTSLNILFSVGLGSLIGAMASLQFSLMFWWVGALIGGIVSYVIYDFKSFYRAVPKAWEMATNIVIQIDKRYWYGLLVQALTVSGAMGGLFVLSFFLSTIFTDSQITENLPLFIGVFLAWYFVFFFAYLCSSTGRYAYNYTAQEKVRVGYRLGTAERYCVICLNPLTVPVGFPIVVIVILFLTLKSAIKNYLNILAFLRKLVVMLFVKLPKVIAKFAWHLFKLVHSDVRFICFVDAVIGSTVGYLLHNPLLGCAIGAILGWVNYKVVALILLKLEPKHT